MTLISLKKNGGYTSKSGVTTGVTKIRFAFQVVVCWLLLLLLKVKKYNIYREKRVKKWVNIYPLHLMIFLININSLVFRSNHDFGDTSLILLDNCSNRRSNQEQPKNDNPLINKDNAKV